MAENPTNAQYFSTGQAAKLCSVTPDTILKWIKGGKLTARRTAGGHHRIPVESLEAFLRDSEGEIEIARMGPGFQYCWEYHADEEIREECQQCLVFRARAMRCFELSALSREAGFCGIFCETSCEACDYFQRQQQRPANVLVVTDDPELRRALCRENDGTRFRLQFTRCEYECSMLVDRFRPRYVVVDCSLPREQCEDLCRHIAQDPRIPDVKIILAVSPAVGPPVAGTGIYPCLEKPFASRQLEEQIGKLDQAGESLP